MAQLRGVANNINMKLAKRVTAPLSCWGEGWGGGSGHGVHEFHYFEAAILP